MKDKIIVTSSEYIISAVSKAQYPQRKLPEIVFVGRSNVGKSSLINSLINRKNLARTSQTPGKTQTINFYKIKIKINANDDSDQIDYKEFYLVDLPGYGYAKTSKSNRKLWSKFIDEYLSMSDNIKFVCQLIDIRHEPMDSDLTMLDQLFNNNLPVLIIATKSDKLSKTNKEKQLQVIKNTFKIPELPVLPYSSIKHEGRSELLEVIADSFN